MAGKGDWVARKNVAWGVSVYGINVDRRFGVENCTRYENPAHVPVIGIYEGISICQMLVGYVMRVVNRVSVTHR